MEVQIIENNHGTIKAFIPISGTNIDEIQVEAEIHSRGICEITRVFIDITPAYGEQNLDMARLYSEIKIWEQGIIDAVEKGSDDEE